MENDRVFMVYAIGLVCLTISMITGAIVLMGGTFPPLAYLIEHLALSLLFRSAYKSLDGSNWIVDAMEYANMITTPEESDFDGAHAMS